MTTADLRQRVDATRFKDYPWGTYDLQSYGGRCGYVKDENMEGRVTVFFSGKMISTGAKSIQHSNKQLNRALIVLVKNKFVTRIKLIPKVQNIVALVDVERKIDLIRLATHVTPITYEPDQFAGAIFRTSEGPVGLIFSSGKIVIVGSKSERQLVVCSSNLKNIIKKFWA